MNSERYNEIHNESNLLIDKDILLEIRNLTIEFKTDGGIQLGVKNLNITLNKQEILGIVGESGSGKSVSSLAIMGLLPIPPGIIRSGNIFFRKRNGEIVDLLKLSEEQMRKLRGNEIAMIFQEPMTSLNPVKRCGEQVAEALLLHKKMSKNEAKKRTIELFNEVKLPRPEQIFTSYPHQISGGQKQRVMIAMAISCEPNLLIADEPTTALDVTIQKTILEILKSLQKKYGMSVIFITHDLGVIAEIARKVAVIYRGEIMETGAIEKLFKNPEHPYTQGLLSCRPPTDKRYQQLPTVSDFVDANDKKTAFEYREISETDRKKRLEKLYSQTPVMQIQNLITEFITEKSLFGKIKSSVKAVNNVSLDIFAGETIGLVGESGCGKTTLGRTLLQMIDAKSGNILYKGIAANQMTNKQMRQFRREVQIIFQDPYSALNPRLTVGSTILEPMTVHKIGKNQRERTEMVIHLLEKVGLKEEHFHRYPHEFSGGQRQRIVIARTLALQPELIVCDESVSALDVSVQAQVLNLLNNLKRDFGFTYVFISHDLSVVKFMSDRIAVMKNGEIVEIGEADSLYFHPKKEYTQTLIDSIPKGL
ncbi:MAG: ABC transporter ATP-binding protein [Bacteroidales bacterium]|nr:ABC transporter ATP-binding protein [Bacteroidales bacterium]